MARTPLEILIDRACGIPDNEAPPTPITLHCIACGRKQRARRDPSDLPGTAVVQARCPECVGGDFDEILYFDAQGKQIMEG